MNKRQGLHPNIGANLEGADGCEFRVWAPHVTTMSLRLLDPSRNVPMQAEGMGYFRTSVQGIGAGQRYSYVLNGNRDLPDPASRAQPDGVHGPSMVVDPSFSWTDKLWHGLPLEDVILYELHVGTFTEAGTFDAIIPYLSYLKQEVGVTAI